MSSTPFQGKSVFWVLLDTVSTSLISIGTMLVLARLAGPRDFGAAALIMGMTLLINLYVEGLFHDALIQNRDFPIEAYDQALTFVLLVAGGIIALTLLGAVIVSTGEYARYGWLSVGSSTLLAFSGPLGIANARLRRDMRFRDVARASVIGRVVGCMVAIAFAYVGFGLAGLVAQTTATAMAQATILFATGNWRPRLRLSFSALGPLLRFALPYAFMHTIVAARVQGFALIVASLMGLSAAGFVNIAFRLTTTPQIALLTTFTNLCFPLLAQQKASRWDLQRAFTVSSKLIATATFPMFIGLALVADDFVPLLLGPGWGPSAFLVKVIAIGAALGFSRTSGSLLLRALGYVRYSFWNASFQLAVTVGGLLLLRPTDPVVAVGLWILPIGIQLPITWFVLWRTGRIALEEQARGFLPALAATCAMAAAVVIAKDQAATSSELVRLIASVMAGGAAYLIAIVLLDDEIRAMIRRRRMLAT
jgi:O-antigen/teichoic acid export membrane protein